MKAVVQIAWQRVRFAIDEMPSTIEEAITQYGGNIGPILPPPNMR